MAGLNVKKGDQVIVIAGKDKGKKGEVIAAYPKEERVVVQGVNKVKRHVRPSASNAGGIVEQEAALHVSNVAHVDPKDGKPTRVGVKVLEDGSKVRVAKRSGEVIDR
ncbi:MAG: 50S ribosomal protein L24 [Magnetospirillum gryphiswaldense]|uniref:50S ribosomal protein L24 n=1 Tax=Magnetospirillum sp. 64-120 TaxID=1895778 RepID=UPI00092AC7C9|nr:50S ribosomal protein L24 [Magnetospirillum sp. 64-120]MBI2242005.1 50S ribosomal protein L24 [Magnetospirillum gryphiswaldense]OJX80040.1 MAG: 50S ribosomal protein L24 [Magnetospirillum sp. 64-120]